MHNFFVVDIAFQDAFDIINNDPSFSVRPIENIEFWTDEETDWGPFEIQM